jgi:ribosomal-protein-alanine N-acetyltransferase
MISIPGWNSGSRECVIEDLRPEDTAAAARLHVDDFVHPWSDGEIHSLLSKPGVFGFVARQTGKRGSAPVGFVLARMAADEAEILTIAVDRRWRGYGLGRKLMDAVLRHLHEQGIVSLFLEVSENNSAARALYGKLGFQPVGQRPGYYEVPGYKRENAIVMRYDFR